ncbi:MAG: WecB/TagA/CpsF family glycosyltransferase [Xanthobacteraceae bacterium]|nr:WecB/TagA/CpsF family glycosyltransferase [Xanthobacteraceae bacterium]
MQTVVTRAGAEARTFVARPDELSREVFGVLGVPIDALGLSASLRTLEAAVARGGPFLFSTPNVNFLVSSKVERQFRESLLLSDLCPVDGMPIVWIARLLGVPIKDRVSGADLFDALKLADGGERPLSVFLFGGADEIASQVGQALNARPRGLKCVGALNPGFGTVDEMSNDAIIKAINDSGADILAVFLNARKAQAWLLHNHDRLQIPVRAQFGATINFEAGTIRRAPSFVRSAGFEWLWRIKEEPYLWRRYWSDGKSLIHLFVNCALPLAVDGAWARLSGAGQAEGLRVMLRDDDFAVTVGLSGLAISRYVDDAIGRFREALGRNKPIVVDVGRTRLIDPRFFGLLLMVRKQLRNRGQALRFVNLSPRVVRAFRLNGFEYLLSGDT